MPDLGYLTASLSNLKLNPEIVEEILRLYQKNPLLKYVNRMGDKDSLLNLICLSVTGLLHLLNMPLVLRNRFYIDVPEESEIPHTGTGRAEPMEVSIRNEVGLCSKWMNSRMLPW